MRDYTQRMERNIFVSYIYNFFMFFRVTMAVWVIYLGFKGMSLVQIGLLESIFHVSCFIFEIPTGALADIFGRKTSIILGRLCNIATAVLMIYSSSFWGFAVAFVFWGLANTLNSGAAESLVYDSVKQLNREQEYKKFSGKINFIVEISMVISVVLGGWLSDISFVYAYIAAVFIDIIAVISASQFEEPQIRTKDGERIGFAKQVTQSVKVLKGKAGVFYMMLFFAAMSTLGSNLYLYGQDYFSKSGYMNRYISLIFTAAGLISALMSKYSYKLERRLNRYGIFILLPLVYFICLAGVSRSSGILMIAFFIICNSLEGFSYPIASDYINSAIPSEYRATILSMYSSLYSVLMIAIFPLVGLLGQAVGLKTAFFYVALLVIPFAAFLLLKLKKHGQY